MSPTVPTKQYTTHSTSIFTLFMMSFLASLKQLFGSKYYIVKLSFVLFKRKPKVGIKHELYTYILDYSIYTYMYIVYVFGIWLIIVFHSLKYWHRVKYILYLRGKPVYTLGKSAGIY